MICSATAFLLLVTFCGTVSSIWYPYKTTTRPPYPTYPPPRPCYGVKCPPIYCRYEQITPPGACCPQCKPAPGSDIHVRCYTDKDCKFVVCDNPREEVECHDVPSSPPRRECHCHIPGECDRDSECVAECGPGATCDDGACHGNCVHT